MVYVSECISKKRVIDNSDNCDLPLQYICEELEVGSSSVVMVPSLYDPSGNGGPTMSLQVLPRNRCTPSIPPVLHVFESL
jgi:hypothetical protein